LKDLKEKQLLGSECVHLLLYDLQDFAFSFDLLHSHFGTDLQRFLQPLPSWATLSNRPAFSVLLPFPAPSRVVPTTCVGRAKTFWALSATVGVFFALF
jgi:hypothetical protein